jgi:malate dehydrogenase (oxaloacetate-decarboxylating)(NADP+)
VAAEACNEIVRDPGEAHITDCARQSGGVVTNGTAVLGPGNIGPLAGKPGMEGKDVCSEVRGIDVFDIELAERDPDKLVDIIALARAHLRRDQPRGHQGARVLLHRAQAARG